MSVECHSSARLWNGPVLVTGASGMVGRAVLARFVSEGGADLRAVLRDHTAGFPAGVRLCTGMTLECEKGWTQALEGVRTVVHAAGRVHVMKDAAADPLAAFRSVNVNGSLQLARRAAAAGVRRLVFVSSIKVTGEATSPGQPFTEASTPHPTDAYSSSKLEGEKVLRVLAEQSEMELVVIRPPLVYGPGVKANFLSLMRWIHCGVPLPLGAIDNRRSLVGLDNLCDLIVTCAQHPAAAGRTFVVSDGEDVSTTELLRRLGQALGRPARLLPVPTWLLQAAFTALGRRDIGQRLCSSLQVDISATCATLGWSPPVPLDEGLRRAAQAYLAEAGEAGAASR